MHKHNRINDKQYEDDKKIDLKAKLDERTKKERQDTGNEKNPEYDSYVNFVQSELMNNKYFKDKNLGSVLQSGIKIYTNMDKDVQQTLQDRINNGSFYKNEDQQVGATILDSKTGGLVAISGGRNYKNVVERNQATDPLPTGSSLKPFLAYGPAIENMKWSTNHAIQDESSYWVDGSQFKNY
ncbi:penicillin-binding transpeptidase domain-containing protein, partial [Staphylococcus warneri]|uniref:penicillin-binding transpeptidase domain-containing protein n=1 Tax=Staphylococcus warneri TaxID=1292 RepID=UPI0010F417A1